MCFPVSDIGPPSADSFLSVFLGRMCLGLQFVQVFDGVGAAYNVFLVCDDC